MRHPSEKVRRVVVLISHWKMAASVPDTTDVPSGVNARPEIRSSRACKLSGGGKDSFCHRFMTRASTSRIDRSHSANAIRSIGPAENFTARIAPWAEKWATTRRCRTSQTAQVPSWETAAKIGWEGDQSHIMTASLNSRRLREVAQDPSGRASHTYTQCESPPQAMRVPSGETLV
jgi:hypothetical protein